MFEDKLYNFPPPDDLNVILDCTLDELYNGCKKSVSYNRAKLNDDFSQVFIAEETKRVDVRKGYNNETLIKYPGEGNQSPNYPNSDLII